MWRAASALSEAFVRDLLPHEGETRGAAYVMNVPSAYAPAGGLGGKPLFAFALKNALAVRGGLGTPSVVAVNHLWLLDGCHFHTRVEASSQGRFRLRTREGGYFSFHGPDADAVYAPDGRTVRPAVLEKPWGQVRVESREAIEVKINLADGDRVMVYDAGEIEVVLDR